MKRRSFLKGLAAALVAPKILLSEKAEAVVPAPKMTVRKGMPPVKWKKLHEGVGPHITATEVRERQEQFNRDVSEMLSEPNPILDDIMWKVYNGRT